MRPTPYLQPPEEYDQDYDYEIIEWEEIDYQMMIENEAEKELLSKRISSYLHEKVTV